MIMYVLSEMPGRWDVYRLADEISNFVAEAPDEEQALALAMTRAKEDPEGAKIVRIAQNGDTRVVADVARISGDTARAADAEPGLAM